jgi:hypothetical protein
MLWRGGLLVRGLPGEPALRGLQVTSVQQQAAVLAGAGPVARPHGQTRMHVEPVEIGLNRADQTLELRVEVVLFSQQDPVRTVELRRHVARIDVAAKHGDEALVGLNCPAELLAADLRRDRRGAEDEDERARSFDAVPDAFAPVRRWRDILEVDPHLLCARRKRGDQPRLDELLVPARVGDEDVRATGLLVRLGGDRPRIGPSRARSGGSRLALTPDRDAVTQTTSAPQPSTTRSVLAGLAWSVHAQSVFLARRNVKPTPAQARGRCSAPGCTLA